MQTLLNTICSWSAEKCMLINASKCFIMLIKPQLRSKHTSITPEVYINEQLVKIVDETTILGVCFTKNIAWISHAEYVIQKSSRMHSVLRRSASSMNSNARCKVFRTFILPHFHYCLPVWGHQQKKSLDKLNNLLIRAQKYYLQRQIKIVSP